MSQRTDCHCAKCKACCLRKPGWFAPGEATKAAAYMKMTLQKFFNAYLTVDFWVGENHTDVLSPAWDTSAFWKKRGALALLANEREDHRGRRASWADGLIEGPCRLLTPTGCKLPFELR